MTALDTSMPTVGACRRQVSTIAVLVAIHTLIVAVAGTLLHDGIHHDMAEAWSWGQHFEAGYHKHPPLFAWVAGTWFHVFPRESWAFYLLSALNSGVGLAGVAMIAHRMLPEREAMAGMLCIMLTPFFSFFAMKFNANSILLSIWPWTVYFFLRALETDPGTPRWRQGLDATMFGAFAGLALLGKYFSVVLVASCVAASLAGPLGIRILLTPTPWIAVTAAAIVIAPHVAWVVSNGFPTVEYAIDKTHSERGAVLLRALAATSQAIAAHGLAAIGFVLLYIGSGTLRQLQPRITPLAILAVGPLALTLLACLVANVRISTQFMIPVFFLMPLVLLRAAGPVSSAGLRNLCLFSASIGAVTGLSLALKSLMIAPMPHTVKMRAEEVTRLWNLETRQPLRIVAGDQQLAMLTTFYSPDAPALFTDFDVRKSPWITAGQVSRDGMLVLCDGRPDRCAHANARPELAGARWHDVGKFDMLGRHGYLSIAIVAPAGADLKPR